MDPARKRRRLSRTESSRITVDDGAIYKTPQDEELRASKTYHGAGAVPRSLNVGTKKVSKTPPPMDDGTTQSSRSPSGNTSLPTTLADLPPIRDLSESRSTGSQTSMEECYLEPYAKGRHAGGVKKVTNKPWDGPSWGPEDAESLLKRKREFTKWLKRPAGHDGEEDIEPYLAKRYKKMEELERQRHDEGGTRDEAGDRQKWDDYYDTTVKPANAMRHHLTSYARQSFPPILRLLGLDIRPHEQVWYKIETASVVDGQAARFMVASYSIGTHGTDLILLAEYKFSASDRNREPGQFGPKALHSSELFYRGLTMWARSGPAESKREKLQDPGSETNYVRIERENSLTTHVGGSPWSQSSNEEEIKEESSNENEEEPYLTVNVRGLGSITTEDDPESSVRTTTESRVGIVEGRNDFEDSSDVESKAAIKDLDSSEGIRTPTNEDNTRDDRQTSHDEPWQTRPITGLHNIWQFGIINPMTQNVIIQAHKAKGKSLLCWGKFKRSSRNKDEVEWEYFKQLLATDNGRPIFMMLNDHREEFGNQEVQEIWTFPPGSVPGLRCFHMILRIGRVKGGDDADPVDDRDVAATVGGSTSVV